MALIEPLSYDHDDALVLRTRNEGTPQIAVYGWETPAVVIGRGGKQELELNLDTIDADGVPVYKRPGGGCAVVLDPGNLIVSLTWPLPGLGAITSSFAAASAWLIDALAACGIPDVKQRGISDLAIGDRKIGGSCIWRSKGLLYYSTTLLVDPDLDLVERYLLHPPREPDYRQGRLHRDFMGSLARLGLAQTPQGLARKLEPVLERNVAELAKKLHIENR